MAFESVLSALSPLAVSGPFGFTFPTTLAAVLVLLIALVILWVVVSLPVYAAGKLVTEGRAGFGDAMVATLGGAIVYFIVLWGVVFFLTPFFGPATPIFGFLLALLAWLAVYSASFDTGFFGTVGIVLVAWAVFFVVDILLVSSLGVSFPKFYPF
jgi:hypothetical protein